MASKYVNNVRTSSFIYDTATPGHSRLLRVRDLTVAGTVYADHAYGPNDDLLWRDQYTNGTTTTNGNFLTDRLGTTRQVYNPSNGYSFPVSGDSWGANAGTGMATEMRFTGEYSDLNTGLVFLRARWYNPAAGTFLSRDPFEGIANYPYSRHQYQYGYSKPTANTDPSGRFGPAACAAMAVADGPIPVGDAAAIACLTFLGISAIVAASTVWNREALEQFADACQELVRNFDDRPWVAPRPDVNTDTNTDVDIAPAPQPEPEPEPTLKPLPAPWDRPIPAPFPWPDPQPNPQPQPTVMPTPQPTVMPTPTTQQEAYVADTNIFTDRPDVKNPSVRQHIDSRYLSNPNVTIYVPAAVDRELAQWVSPLQTTRRKGYGAKIVPISDGDLTGINTAALESNAFDYNDMAILQAAKDRNLPLLSTNNIKLQNQILAKQFPDRRKFWGGVSILYP
jgi:RHS repeat-associated protein